MEWGFGSIENPQEFIHAAEEPGEQAIEGDEASFFREDPFEPGFELGGAFGARIVFIEFEITVEPPDQFSGDVERPSLIVVEAVEFMHQTLGVDPTECMVIKAELAGAVGDDHGVLKETVVADAPKKGAFGCDFERNWLADAELVKMG